MKLKLIRFFDDGETTIGRLLIKTNYIGKLAQYNKIFRYFTCERSWKDNQQNISCIPAGIYDIEPYNSPFHGKVLMILNVPNRSNIEMHSGNTYIDTKGCICAGKQRGNRIYNRKHNEHNIGVLKSKDAMKEIVKMVNCKTTIEIINQFHK